MADPIHPKGSFDNFRNAFPDETRDMKLCVMEHDDVSGKLTSVLEHLGLHGYWEDNFFIASNQPLSKSALENAIEKYRGEDS